MRIPIPATVLIVALWLPAASAQSTANPETFNDALAFRASLADLVRSGTEMPEQVIARLKTQESPTGFKLDRDADFALAAIDIGHRLIAVGKYAEAEKFFQAADEALGKVIDKTKDADARGKSLYFQQRAMIRAKFLNQPAKAKADIEAAQKLQPDDKDLKRTWDVLANDKAEHFKGKEQPTKG